MLEKDFIIKTLTLYNYYKISAINIRTCKKSQNQKIFISSINNQIQYTNYLKHLTVPLTSSPEFNHPLIISQPAQ
jgi:hypothetical protein